MFVWAFSIIVDCVIPRHFLFFASPGLITGNTYIYKYLTRAAEKIPAGGQHEITLEILAKQSWRKERKQMNPRSIQKKT